MEFKSFFFLTRSRPNMENFHVTQKYWVTGLSSSGILNTRKQRDRLCGLLVRVISYRSLGPGTIPGTTRKKKVVGLEWGPLSLVSTTEKLLDRKVAAPL
jgi:hypothetical protein